MADTRDKIAARAEARAAARELLDAARRHLKACRAALDGAHVLAGKHSTASDLMSAAMSAETVDPAFDALASSAVPAWNSALRCDSCAKSMLEAAEHAVEAAEAYHRRVHAA